MNYIQPQSRGQVEMTSMDMLISSDNEVRVLDTFVEELEMEKLGFSLQVKDEGEVQLRGDGGFSLIIFQTTKKTKRIQGTGYRHGFYPRVVSRFSLFIFS